MSMNKDSIIAFLEDMIETLTFRRVSLISLLVTVSISLLAIFENREALFASVYMTSKISTQERWVLSNESKNEIIAITNSDIVGSVILSDIDLMKNRHTVKFFYDKDQKDLEKTKIYISGLLPQALFDFDHQNTEQMVAMLNNEFRCSASKDTSFSRSLPVFTKKFPYVCRLAVPPFFGEFAGVVSIGLFSRPSESEFDALKIELNRIAVEIYLRDISKKLAS